MACSRAWSITLASCAPWRPRAAASAASVADTAILPMQDVLGLDGRARMNLPGSPKGNWRWRLGRDWRARAARASPDLRALLRATGRAAAPSATPRR